MDLSYSFLLNVIVFFQIMYNEDQPSLNLYIREIKTFYLKKKTNKQTLVFTTKSIIVATPDQASGAKKGL